MGKTRQPVATGFSKSLRVESRTERLTGVRQDRGANRSVLRAAALERGARAESGGRRPRRLTLDVDSLPIEFTASSRRPSGMAIIGTGSTLLVTSVAETADMLDARPRPGAVGTAEGALDLVLPRARPPRRAR